MLTAKQEAFAKAIVEGMNQADAYRSAYSTKNMADKTVWENASRLAADSKVSARIAELRERLASESIMSAQQRLRWLTEIIMNSDASMSDKLKAADIMNKMQGEYVQKVQAEVQTETTINIELVDDE